MPIFYNNVCKSRPLFGTTVIARAPESVNRATRCVSLAATSLSRMLYCRILLSERVPLSASSALSLTVARVGS